MEQMDEWKKQKQTLLHKQERLLFIFYKFNDLVGRTL